MKLSNAIIYRSMLGTELDAEAVEEAMSTHTFVPTGPTEEHSSGWVPPRGEDHGALVEVVGDHWIMKFMIETRAVPATAVRKHVDAMVERIEETTGRKPGKRERKELKEEALRELLPRAFPKVASVNVWIDTAANFIIVDATSQGKADAVASALVQSVEGLALSKLHTTQDPAAAMSGWLHSQEPPASFTIDRDVELQALDESKAVIKYQNHPLDIEEVRHHIENGKRPTRLAMTWDDRVSFSLTEGFALRGLTYLEGTAQALGDQPPEDAFDADVAISTGECSLLIAALVEALGGEAQMTVADAEKQQPAAVSAGTVAADMLVDAARAIVIEKRKASISLVQRHLKIGYNRAAQVIEALEQRGTVSAPGADGTRTVLEVA